MEVRRPNRVTHHYVQHLLGPPAQIFPLLCPVREAEWLERWDPHLVLSRSGLAEPDCVFTTAAGDREAIWIVSHHDPAAYRLEMYRVTPQVTVCRIDIHLFATASGCDAHISYAHTSLGPLGDAFVARFTESLYTGFMQDWETRLNHFLMTGECLMTGLG